MDPSTLLSQLKDVHAPDPITFWPLAFGWWVLIILSTLAIISLSFWFLKRRLKSTWKRQAQKRFEALCAIYKQQPSAGNLLKINRLLKQALSSANNKRDYLHFCENEWADTLKSVKHKNVSILQEQEISILSKGIYGRQTDILDSEALNRISLWIKHLG